MDGMALRVTMLCVMCDRGDMRTHHGVSYILDIIDIYPRNDAHEKREGS